MAHSELQIVDQPEYLQIIIPPNPPRGYLLHGVAYLVVALVCLVFAFGQLVVIDARWGSGGDIYGELLFIAALVVVAGFAIYKLRDWLWLAFGVETVTIDSRRLTIERTIPGMRLAKEFRLEEVQNLRVEKGGEKYLVRFREYFERITDIIVFDHKGNRREFGTALEPGRAGEILEMIRRR